MRAGLDRHNPKQAQVTGLRITLDARSPVWELPPVKNAGSPVALVGWTTDTDPLDAGVPPLARTLLARALTRLARVTFPHPDIRLAADDWQETAEGSIKVLTPGHARALRKRSPITLLSTTSAESAVRLFTAFPYSWEMKTQVAILTDRLAPPPRLSYETVEALLNREPIDEPALVAEAQVRGLLTPAVDGDFAALIGLAPTLLRALVDVLAEECAGAGVGWETLTESEFLGN